LPWYSRCLRIEFKYLLHKPKKNKTFITHLMWNLATIII
jgi:hypothetical protein